MPSKTTASPDSPTDGLDAAPAVATHEGDVGIDDAGSSSATRQVPAVLSDSADAVERFIVDQLEPRLDQLQTWNGTSPHDQLLAAAAKRKKITVKKISDANQLLFLSGVVIGGMDAIITSLVSHQARRVSRSKQMTKKYLQASEVPTPKGRAISPTEFSRAVKYMKALGGPVAVKPSSGRAGKGISTAVRTEGELRQAWQRAMASRSATSDSKYQMIVEEHHPGVDLRVYVVGEQVAGAIVRVPFYVVGDGVSTVGELAETEIARRQDNAYLRPRQPKVTDDFLAPVGLSTTDVPAAGQVRRLTEIADTSRGGGLAVDVTDELPDALRDLAVDGLWSVPGLSAAAVDLLVPDLETGEGAVVLDINPYANIMQFRYPAYGEPRMVHDAIMEQILHRASR
ncbi:ATP-binding protein [Nesterenkonia sp. K-15-9-6]|uniref:ATP-binding protein n=1 Tax=Nesterenkonia sp. K-15-9-6 TaxID=3093918 RepID=UPI004044C743